MRTPTRFSIAEYIGVALAISAIVWFALTENANAMLAAALLVNLGIAIAILGRIFRLGPAASSPRSPGNPLLTKLHERLLPSTASLPIPLRAVIIGVTMGLITGLILMLPVLITILLPVLIRLW